jgi:uncharacterized SAM-binding protein YcdF (DUF218 family)
MFFILSKTVTFLLLPSNLLILAGLVGVVLLSTRWRRVGSRLASASVVLLAAIGFLPVGDLLLRPLEGRFPPWDASRGVPVGIVVLGGAIDPRNSQGRGESQLNDAAERVVAIAKLAREFPNARIIYSGGNGSLLSGWPPEADLLPPLLDRLGVERNRVTLEARSRNTAENARYSKELAKPQPGDHWLLVTSAFHMPRAIGCFRRVGFSVEAYPVDWNAPRGLRFDEARSIAIGLGRTDDAIHEWAGLVVYWLTGRTSELFPGPAASR